jgi:hypothetical protein
VFQDILAIWPGAPVEIKMLIVFAVSLSISYIINRWGLLIVVALFFVVPAVLMMVRGMGK